MLTSEGTVQAVERRLGLAPLPDLETRRARLLWLDKRGLLDGPLPPILAYSGLYSRELCRLLPDYVFLFGDNLIGRGFGGQAVIRHEPNAFGVPTKFHPSNAAYDFFYDGQPTPIATIGAKLKMIENKLTAGDHFVVPITHEGRISLGCGLAQLPQRAPHLYGLLEAWFNRHLSIAKVIS